MPLNDILKTIEEEQNKKIKKINEENEIKLKELEADYACKISTKEKEILISAKNEIKQKIKKEKFLLNMKENNALLEKRWGIIDNAYKKALDKLSNLSSGEKEKIFEKWLKDCPNKGKIITSQNSAKILEKLAKKEQTISSNKISAIGGFIFKADKVIIDNTFENIILQMRENTEVEVGKILF